MEAQARYTLVGLFTLVVVAAGFAFVYWLHGFADIRTSAIYRLRFEAPVVGLRPGVAVLFNGLRVGEVTSVAFDPNVPSILTARIAVAPTTPVRADTRVGVDAESLLAGATVALTGGASTQPLQPGPDGEPPLLIAPADQTQSMSGAARTALARLDGILAENAKPLHTLLDNLSTFSAALQRNSGRVDSILAGLEKMTGGGPPAPPPVSYKLAAPEFPARETSPDKATSAEIAVPEPTALVVYDTQKVLVAPGPNQLKPLPEGQWADSVPKLVQAGILDSLANAGFAHIAKAMEGFASEAQLQLEIRSFELVVGTPPMARIEIYARRLATEGKITEQRRFVATAPAKAVDGVAGAAALNEAFQTIARDIVGWMRATE
jgi:phospholipid/cholesterol/gamma-HCH transport system substrate-binding protein